MKASIFCHICLGSVLSLFFVLYYINGNGKWKIYLEFLLGIGGNIGGIFILDNYFNIDNIQIRMYSIAFCLFSFLILTFLLLIIFSHIIKEQNISFRDILLGQKSWIDKYYDTKIKEIEKNLNIDELKKREEEIIKKENLLIEKEKKYNEEYIQKENLLQEKNKIIEEKESSLEEELKKIENLGKQKLQLFLPAKSKVIITKDYVELIPSYFRDINNCILEMNFYEVEYLKKDKINLNNFNAFLISIATAISTYIFNTNSSEIRIHFRYLSENENHIKGYKKLIAIIGKKVVENNMTFIPYNKNNMISKSFECKRALIRSKNIEYDYKSNNYKVWKDYLTYTFYNLEIEGIPFLSFGISVKNEARYKNIFYFLNHIKFEDYLQEKIESINSHFSIEQILYGGRE